MKSGDDFLDFLTDGGDELLNSEICPHCGAVIYLDHGIEWIDRAQRVVKCPECGEKVNF